MKKILVLILGLIMVMAFAVPVQAESISAQLVIGRDAAVNAGTVDVDYDSAAGNVTVTYAVDPALNGGWQLVETHIYVGIAAPTKSAPGKFPYRAVPTDNPNIWTCTVPVNAGEEGVVYVAAHAALTQTVVTPNPIEGEAPIVTVIEETGWAQAETGNTPIPPGKNWATYFTVAGGEDSSG